MLGTQSLLMKSVFLYLIIKLLMIQKNSILFIFFLLLIAPAFSQENSICSTKCREGFCTLQNSLSCTGCHNQYILISNQCIPIGGQPDSIKYYNSVTQNSIIDQSRTNRNLTEIICKLGSPQTANMTFFDETVSIVGLYYSEPFAISLPMKHEYIQVRMNAILFNRRADASIQLLIVNAQGQDLVKKIITPNILNPNQQNLVSCIRNAQQVPASYPFYINEQVSITTSGIFVQLITQQIGDLLGISNFQVFYGNCHPSCKTCFGSASNQCLSCRNLLKFNQNSNECTSCPLGFYQLLDGCRPCPYNCEQCVYSEASGTPVCTQCITGIPESTLPQCYIFNQVYENFQEITFNKSESWTSNSVAGNLVTTCGRYSLLGGIPLGLGNSIISKTFIGLKVHKQIWIKFTMMVIDQEPGSVYKAYIQVDDVIVKEFELTIASTEQNNTQCGADLLEFIDGNALELNIPHEGPSVKISISGSTNFFGIRDFILGVQNMTNVQNCLAIYPNGSCSQCNNGLQLQPDGTCSGCALNYYMVNGNCEICPIFCRQCAQEATSGQVRCTSCYPPLKFSQQLKNCIDEEKALYTVAISPKIPTQTTLGWSLYPNLQKKGVDSCGGDNIMGSSEIRYRNFMLRRTFANVPKHQGVILHFRFYQIDDYGGIFGNQDRNVTVYFKINSKVFPYTVSLQGRQLCGNSTLDHIKTIYLAYNEHTDQNLVFQVHANRVKFGINQLLVFLQNCEGCQDTSVSYIIETIPEYYLDFDDTLSDRIKFKIVFNEFIRNLTNTTNEYFSINFNKPNADSFNITLADFNRSTGNLEQSKFFQGSYLKKEREYIGYRSFFEQLNKWNYSLSPTKPDLIFSKVSTDGVTKPLSLEQSSGNLPRFDHNNLEEDQANLRNLRNFFRGIAVLGMWIGMISFLFGLSAAFDDLFVLTQIIFVHIFIQSQWLAASFKIPVGGMKFVQFLQWLPNVAKDSIQSGIIPGNHYQRSPIVYEQYYKDITFARAIYHIVLFMVIILAFFFLVKVVRAFSRPTLGQLIQENENNKKIQSHKLIKDRYFQMHRNPFTFLEKFVRFIFFTVVWACILQFTHFTNEPFSFFQWNAAICIIFFVVFVLYPFLSFAYLWRKSGFSSTEVFDRNYFGVRLRKTRLWYLLFKYIKLLVIALLIGLLYKSNPLASLIPLMIIHIGDAFILFFAKPYHLKQRDEYFLSFFGQHYWLYYRWSFIVQNILFFVLELILVIMYGRRQLADKVEYFSIGYAACAFVILLLINGLIRVAWTLIRYFEVLYEDVQSSLNKVDSENNENPCNEVRNNINPPQSSRPMFDRPGQRKLSIQKSIPFQFNR